MPKGKLNVGIPRSSQQASLSRSPRPAPIAQLLPPRVSLTPWRVAVAGPLQSRHTGFRYLTSFWLSFETQQISPI
jgi:hypothetical protein